MMMNPKTAASRWWCTLLLCATAAQAACPFSGRGRQLGSSRYDISRDETNSVNQPGLRQTPLSQEEADESRQLQQFIGTTEEAIDRMLGDVANLLRDDRSMAPKLVQLGFHDCVGGCDGCVDLTDAGHAGLERPMQVLQPICSKFMNGQISRADCWSIAAKTAVQSLQPEFQSLTYDLSYGRQDCQGADAMGSGGPAATPQFPSSLLSTQALLDFFAAEFGFSARQTVVAMGAHSLGRAHPEVSGYDGPWDDTELVLDTAFYVMLLHRQQNKLFGAPSHEYHQVPASHNDFFVFERERTLNQDEEQDTMIMLNVDVSLVVDFGDHVVNATSGEIGCYINPTLSPACPKASTFGVVEALARDQATFLSEFRDVYTLMLQNKNGPLTSYIPKPREFGSPASRGVTTSSAPPRPPTSRLLLFVSAVSSAVVAWSIHP